MSDTERPPMTAADAEFLRGEWDPKKEPIPKELTRENVEGWLFRNSEKFRQKRYEEGAKRDEERIRNFPELARKREALGQRVKDTLDRRFPEPSGRQRWLHENIVKPSIEPIKHATETLRKDDLTTGEAVQAGTHLLFTPIHLTYGPFGKLGQDYAEMTGTRGFREGVLEPAFREEGVEAPEPSQQAGAEDLGGLAHLFGSGLHATNELFRTVFGTPGEQLSGKVRANITENIEEGFTEVHGRKPTPQELRRYLGAVERETRSARAAAETLPEWIAILGHRYYSGKKGKPGAKQLLREGVERDVKAARQAAIDRIDRAEVAELEGARMWPDEAGPPKWPNLQETPLPPPTPPGSVRPGGPAEVTPELQMPKGVGRLDLAGMTPPDVMGRRHRLLEEMQRPYQEPAPDPTQVFSDQVRGLFEDLEQAKADLDIEGRTDISAPLERGRAERGQAGAGEREQFSRDLASAYQDMLWRERNREQLEADVPERGIGPELGHGAEGAADIARAERQPFLDAIETANQREQRRRAAGGQTRLPFGQEFFEDQAYRGQRWREHAARLKEMSDREVQQEWDIYEAERDYDSPTMVEWNREYGELLTNEMRRRNLKPTGMDQAEGIARHEERFQDAIRRNREAQEAADPTTGGREMPTDFSGLSTNGRAMYESEGFHYWPDSHVRNYYNAYRKEPGRTFQTEAAGWELRRRGLLPPEEGMGPVPAKPDPKPPTEPPAGAQKLKDVEVVDSLNDWLDPLERDRLKRQADDQRAAAEAFGRESDTEAAVNEALKPPQGEEKLTDVPAPEKPADLADAVGLERMKTLREQLGEGIRAKAYEDAERPGVFRIEYDRDLAGPGGGFSSYQMEPGGEISGPRTWEVLRTLGAQKNVFRWDAEKSRYVKATKKWIDQQAKLQTGFDKFVESKKKADAKAKADAPPDLSSLDELERGYWKEMTDTRYSGKNMGELRDTQIRESYVATRNSIAEDPNWKDWMDPEELQAYEFELRRRGLDPETVFQEAEARIQAAQTRDAKAVSGARAKRKEKEAKADEERLTARKAREKVVPAAVDVDLEPGVAEVYRKHNFQNYSNSSLVEMYRDSVRSHRHARRNKNFDWETEDMRALRFEMERRKLRPQDTKRSEQLQGELDRAGKLKDREVWDQFKQLDELAKSKALMGDDTVRHHALGMEIRERGFTRRPSPNLGVKKADRELRKDARGLNGEELQRRYQELELDRAEKAERTPEHKAIAYELERRGTPPFGEAPYQVSWEAVRDSGDFRSMERAAAQLQHSASLDYEYWKQRNKARSGEFADVDALRILEQEGLRRGLDLAERNWKRRLENERTGGEHEKAVMAEYARLKDLSDAELMERAKELDRRESVMDEMRDRGREVEGELEVMGHVKALKLELERRDLPPIFEIAEEGHPKPWNTGRPQDTHYMDRDSRFSARVQTDEVLREYVAGEEALRKAGKEFDERRMRAAKDELDRRGLDYPEKKTPPLRSEAWKRYQLDKGLRSRRGERGEFRAPYGQQLGEMMRAAWVHMRKLFEDIKDYYVDRMRFKVSTEGMGKLQRWQVYKDRALQQVQLWSGMHPAMDVTAYGLGKLKELLLRNAAMREAGHFVRPTWESLRSILDWGGRLVSPEFRQRLRDYKGEGDVVEQAIHDLKREYNRVMRDVSRDDRVAVQRYLGDADSAGPLPQLPEHLLPAKPLFDTMKLLIIEGMERGVDLDLTMPETHGQWRTSEGYGWLPTVTARTGMKRLKGKFGIAQDFWRPGAPSVVVRGLDLSEVKSLVSDVSTSPLEGKRRAITARGDEVLIKYWDKDTRNADMRKLKKESARRHDEWKELPWKERVKTGQRSDPKFEANRIDRQRDPNRIDDQPFTAWEIGYRGITRRNRIQTLFKGLREGKDKHGDFWLTADEWENTPADQRRRYEPVMRDAPWGRQMRGGYIRNDVRAMLNVTSWPSEVRIKAEAGDPMSVAFTRAIDVAAGMQNAFKRSKTIESMATMMRQFPSNISGSIKAGNFILDPTNWPYYSKGYKLFWQRFVKKEKRNPQWLEALGVSLVRRNFAEADVLMGERLAEAMDRGPGMTSSFQLGEAMAGHASGIGGLIEVAGATVKGTKPGKSIPGGRASASLGRRARYATGRGIEALGSGVRRAAEGADAVLGVGYSFFDEWFKLAAWLKNMDVRGMSPKDAAIAVDKAFANYGEAPFAVDVQSKNPFFGDPFGKFSALENITTLETAIENPARAAVASGAYYGIRKVMAATLTAGGLALTSKGSEVLEDALDAMWGGSLGVWTNARMIPAFWDEQGDLWIWDATYVDPSVSLIISDTRGIGEHPLDPALSKNIRAAARVVGIDRSIGFGFLNRIFDRDPRTGKPVTRPGVETGEDFGHWLEQWMEEAGSPLAPYTPGGWARGLSETVGLIDEGRGRHVRRVEETTGYDERSQGLRVLESALGIGIRKFDPKKERSRMAWALKAAERDIMSDARREIRRASKEDRAEVRREQKAIAKARLRSVREQVREISDDLKAAEKLMQERTRKLVVPKAPQLVPR